MVLAGGPDCERDVSLQSGEQVASALRTFGHRVRLRDIGPEHLGAIDQFLRWPGDVMFCALHGKWGEGGGVQRLLEQHGISFVGCGAAAAKSLECLESLTVFPVSYTHLTLPTNREV